MSFSKIAISGAIFLITALPVISSAQEKQKSMQVSDWLTVGPVEVSKPVFDSLPDINGKKFGDDMLFSSLVLPPDTSAPAEGAVCDPGKFTWEKRAAQQGKLYLDEPSGTSFTLWMVATYVETERYTQLKLNIKSHYRYELWFDGEKLSSADPSDGKPATGDPSVKIIRGKHLLLVKLMAETESGKKKHDGFALETSTPGVTFTTNPVHPIDMAHVLEGTNVSGCDINSNGTYYRLDFRTVVKGEGKSFGKTVICRSDDDKVVWSNSDENISSVAFTPDGTSVSYLLQNDEGKNFVIEDLVTGRKKVTGAFDKVNDYTWSPDGRFLIYSINEEGPKETDLSRHIEDPNDRWPWYRSRSLLAIYNFETGIHERLTWGFKTTALESVAYDGSFILFSVSEPDFTERPYSRQQLYKLDLKTRATNRIWDMQAGGRAVLSPDNHTLLVTGSPVMFDGIGNVLPENVIPNDFDTQAYLYDLTTGKATPLTRSFDPKINDAQWADQGRSIFFLTEDRTRDDIYSYNLSTGRFKKIGGLADAVASVSVSPVSDRLVAFGTSVSAPTVAWRTSLNTDEPVLIANPGKDWFDNIRFGRVEDFVFTTSQGDSIDGMVFYPPDFDPAKKYPVIVYYYGGTSPTNRSFEGRYPKNMFAAMGYIVYTLNPDGCTGYGAEFAARHVNNWGITTADQIIEGTRKFLRSHPAADSTRVGCIGASYGGFMTMLLQTRTNLFRTAIAHAGISNLSNYWGDGFWGYLYSGTATAGKFPWNAPDLYTKQSPLYNADKIKTPMLLLYGNKDTNVPVAESHQLFTALKLLGQEVEMIEFDGQDHQILSYKPRIKWQNTIFAWFAKWLKDEPEWWNDLYPERRF